VLPLAAVLAVGDAFWVVALRGTVGSIERSQQPFAGWLRESVLLLPLLAFAILAALTLAMRRFGPTLRRPRTVIATAFLVVGATTLAGFLVLLANAGYDYHLQSSQAKMMGSMGTRCQGHCLTAVNHHAFMLQVRAVLYGTGILLATNLVLVAWTVAMRGGRLDLTRQVRPWAEDKADAATEARASRLGDIQVLLVAGLLGSAVLHAAVVPAHLPNWTTAGALSLALAAAELALAMQVGAALRTGVLRAVVVFSAVPLVLWALSGTTGLPFGPGAGARQPVGLTDLMAAVLEVGTLVVALLLMRRTASLRDRPRASAHVHQLAVLAVVIVATIGLAGTSLTWFDDLTPGFDTTSQHHH
jgi:hypothetical protein